MSDDYIPMGGRRKAPKVGEVWLASWLEVDPPELFGFWIAAAVKRKGRKYYLGVKLEDWAESVRLYGPDSCYGFSDDGSHHAHCWWFEASSLSNSVFRLEEQLRDPMVPE
jgi:hypothetical protein